MRLTLPLVLLLLIAGPAFAQPVASFTATPLTGCAPMVVSFTSTSTGSPTSYLWTFGSSLIPPSSSQNPIVAYTVPGIYTVTLTVTNASGSNTKTQSNYITVKQVPVVAFSGSPLTGCIGTAISFSPNITWNSAGTGTYGWDFGDGGSSAASNPTHTYTNSGTYTVKLTAINTVGCPATDTIPNYISIYPAPVLNFTASDTAICALNGSTIFTANNSGTGPFTNTWDFGDGSSPLTATGSVSHSYGSVGSYTVKLTVTDGHGCTDSVKKINYIKLYTVSAGFTAASTACQGASVAMANTSPTAGVSVSWDFGDGITATGNTTAHTYTTAGIFTITEFVSLGGCTTTATSQITINPKPNATFNFSPQNPCPAPIGVQFNLTGSTGTTYNWFFGDGTSGSGTSPLHTYGYNDTFVVIVNAYNSYGCSSSYSKNVLIWPMALFVVSDKMDGCVPLNITYQDSLLTYDTVLYPSKHAVPVHYPLPVSSYNWSFGDGGTSTSAAPVSHTYYTPGTYPVILTLTTSNGCTISDTVIRKGGNLPVVNFGAFPRTICVNTPVNFYDSSTTTNLPVNSWKWDFGDGNGATAQNPIETYYTPGVYNVQLIAGINGCIDSLTKMQYIVVNDPKSQMLVKVSCDTPLLVHFTYQSIGGTSHIYYFGDGSGSTATNPDHTYGAPGVYVTSLVTYNSFTGCKDSLVHRINLNPISVSFVATKTSVCKGDSVHFTATVTGGQTPQAFAWWLGTGSTPNLAFTSSNGGYGVQGFSTAGFSGGLYSAAVVVADENSCLSTPALRINYITVGAPIPKFSALPPRGCSPAYITFKDSSYYPSPTTATTRYWDFGDGTNATTSANSIGHTYPLPGTYGIKLIVTDNLGCMDSLFISNYMVVTHPSAIWTTQGNNACLGAPFIFYSSSTGNSLTYNWDFGDGGTSTLSSPSHTYTATGTYSVRLIVTDANGCSDTATKLNYIVVIGRPKASFTMDDTLAVCPPLRVNFTNTSSAGAISYNWSFGTGGGSTLQNPSNTYISPKIYTVALIATNAAGCRDTAYGRVKVLGYAGVLSYSPLKGCAPLNVNFVARDVDGVPGFVYDFGDGTPPVGTTHTTISHTYTKAGPHVPSITLTDNLGCSVKSIGIDTIKVDGVIAGFTFSPFPACDKGTIQFIDTSSGAYSSLNPSSWRFHDGTTSNLASPSKTYPGPGTYAVILYTSTSSGCKDTLNSSITFYPLPVIDAGKDTLICLTDSAILMPTGGATYAWSPSISLSCASCTHPYAFPISNTRYTVIGTDIHGCTGKDTVTVRIRTKAKAIVSPGAVICSGDTISISASGGGTYTWMPSKNLSSGNIGNPLAYPDSNTQYMVIVKLASCVPDTGYVNIVVHPTPKVDAGANQTVIAGTPVQLQGLGSLFITHWEWTPPEDLSCVECAAPEANPKHSVTYIVTASTDFDCHATDSVHITVVCDHSQVYIPNTFTPDGNGVNDVFYPRGRGLQTINYFRIYDRWGEVVFERSNMTVDDRTQGWDGRKAGRLLSPDVYVYTVDAVCDTGEPIKWQGNVMLLR